MHVVITLIDKLPQHHQEKVLPFKGLSNCFPTPQRKLCTCPHKANSFFTASDGHLLNFLTTIKEVVFRKKIDKIKNPPLEVLYLMF